MRHPAYAEIPKTLEYRLAELIQSLNIIQDSFDLLERGHVHQILPIAGQLRALLLDKTTPPLLFAVADAVGVKLEVWTEGAIPGNRGPSVHPEVVFSLRGTGLTPDKEFSEQRPIELREVLGSVVLYAAETKFTARDVIEFLANKAGGAHYDEHLPQGLGFVMATIEIGGLPAPANAVAQLGFTTLTLGRKLLRQIIQVDFDLVTVLRRPPIGEPALLFETRHVAAASGYRVDLAPNLALTFGVGGVDGEFRASTQNATDWSTPHHVRFSHRVTDNLRSKLEVSIDGEVRSEWTWNRLIPALSNPNAHDVFCNINRDGHISKADWALAQFEMVSPAVTAYERAERLLEFRRLTAETAEYRCFSNGRYLVKTAGSQAFVGDAAEVDWRAWLSEV